MAVALSSQTNRSGVRVRSLVQVCLVAAVAAVLWVMPSELGATEPVDIAGSWSGGGSVSFPSGSLEKARCRATYNKIGTSSYSVNATCATPSGKVAQTANVKRVSANSFAGSFFNADYNLNGTIHVSVQGNSQNVTLSSSTATASLRLSR